MHQANYIPWLGYFYKLAQSDVFVLLDSVQYPRGRHVSARNKIKTPSGDSWLSIPVSVPGQSNSRATYNDVLFSNHKWADKHLRTIELNYKKAPYFNEIMPLLAEKIKNAERLIDLNIDLIESIANYLGITTPRLRLSHILTEFGQKNDLIIDICRAVKADVYLSGNGARAYNDRSALASHGIDLIYSDFQHPVYNQLWGAFVPNLSVIDLLFNHGPHSREILLQKNY